MAGRASSAQATVVARSVGRRRSICPVCACRDHPPREARRRSGVGFPPPDWQRTDGSSTRTRSRPPHGEAARAMRAAIHAGPQQAPVHFAQPGVVELREEQHRHRGRKGSSRALAPRARPKPAQPGRDSPSLEIRDPRSGTFVASLRTAAWRRSVAFSPDGSLVATGDWDGRAQLWSTETWKPAGRPLEGHEKRILTLDFSRDGRTLAFASEDGTVVPWDVDTRTAVGSPLTVDANRWTSAAFTPASSRRANWTTRFPTGPIATSARPNSA